MELKDYVDKNVILFYDDGSSVSRKSGRVVSIDEGFIFIEAEEKPPIAIPISRIVRIELAEGQK
jgi:hypothetical protein